MNRETSSAQVDGVTGPTTLVFELTATDPAGAASTDQLTVTVRRPK